MSLFLRSNSNNLYRLASTATSTTGGATLAFVKPAVAAWSGRIPRSFSSMNPKRRVDDTSNNASTMDESDQLEIGKKAKNHEESKVTSKEVAQKEVSTTANNSLLVNRHPLFREFDEFFARDPFFEPFHSLDPFLYRRSRAADRIFDRMMNNMFLLNDTFPFPTVRTRHAGGSKTATPALLRSSPAYEIKESDDMYEITVQIPKGMQAADLNVEMDDDNDVIHISGSRKESNEKEEAGEAVEDGDSNKPQPKMMSETRFDKWFRMDGAIVDREQMNANFSDGVLALKVPKIKLDDVKPKKTKIAITENPHQKTEGEMAAEVDEIKEKSFSDEFDESDWVETGKSNPHPESMKM